MHTPTSQADGWFRYGNNAATDQPVRFAILTSWDIPRLRRAIRSLQDQTVPAPFWVEINSQREGYPEQARVLCKEMGVDCHVSESNGTPGLGKQAVFNRFCDDFSEPFLYQIDGDDWLFPCASQSIIQTVQDHPEIDFLSHLSIDFILFAKSKENPDPSLIVCMYDKDDPIKMEPETGISPSIWNPDENLVKSPGRPSLFSRHATQTLEWHPFIPILEDLLITVDALVLSRKDKLNPFFARVYDTYIVDKTTPGSLQKTRGGEEASEEAREEALFRVQPDQSAMGSIPLIEQTTLLEKPDKIDYIKQTYPLSHE